MEVAGGEHEWVIDVVLRANGHAPREAEVVAEVARSRPDAAEPPRATASFDLEPPDGSIGVSCPMSAPNAGEAVDRALELVGRAAAEVTGEELALWDLRVVPRGAVLAREAWAPPSGAMLRRRRSWRRG